MLSFNWAFAHKSDKPEYAALIASLIFWKPLRRGSLYQCSNCHETWHLDGENQTMTHVSSARLPLVLEWDQVPIVLSDVVEGQLEDIGPTPPDVYGNGIERRVTPCKVVTLAGEIVDPALVCVQLDAPVQHHAQIRLGGEIASVSSSAFALPLDIRIASSRAYEMRMGFSPSLIEMPDGKRFVLNGMTSFLDEPGYEAATARAFDSNFFDESPPPPFAKTPIVTYFVVDGDPAWAAQREEGARPNWLRRLFQR